MTAGPKGAELAIAAMFAAAGLAFGSGYFITLRWAVNLYCENGRALSIGALTMGRLAAAIGFFALAVHSGALALFAAFVGFLIVRTFAVRTVRSQA